MPTGSSLVITIAVAFLCQMWFVRVLAGPYRLKREDGSIPPADLLNPFTPRPDVSKTFPDPQNCVSQCVENNYMTLRINPDNKQDCKVERDFLRCLKACPRSDYRHIILRSHTVGKMICMINFEEYKKHQTCIQSTPLNKSPNATFQECPQSGSEEIMEFVSDPFTASGLNIETNGDIVLANLTKICTNYNCNIQFNEEAMRNTCGKAASELWIRFLIARVKAALEVYKAFKVINTTIPQCDTLLNS